MNTSKTIYKMGINNLKKKGVFGRFYKRYLRFHSSIFGRVVIIITLLSIFLFLSFGFIFKSVYDNYLNNIIRQNGENIGSVVEGALYRSMLRNDKTQLQNTLDLIKTMPGIDEVSLYDSKDRLAYASFSYNAKTKGETECTLCHTDFQSMFPRLEKSYRIINESNPCNQRSKAEEGDFRQLMIRSPILNDRTCYVSSCHAHTETQDILGSLIIKMPLHQIDTSIAESTRDFFMLAAASTLLLVFVLIYFTHQKIKHPLKAILTASEGVARGNDSMRLEIKPDLLDDMRVVSLAFNNMLDKLNIANEALKEWSEQLEFKVEEKTAELSQIQGELIHIEKMASLGKLSSSVAHEINNPLTGVLTFTKLVHKQLKKETLPGETKMMMLKYLTIIEDETKRCGGIVNGLLDFSQKHQDDFQNKSLNTILKNTYELMQHQMKLANINFTQDCKAKADLIFCNENQIKQACVAMLVNAREAIAVSGNISIESENPDNQHILIRISDTGIGIKQELIKHIFEPFFSAKSRANSIGLGLSIVHGIVENHKGKIEVHSQLGSGTSLSILFPLVV